MINYWLCDLRVSHFYTKASFFHCTKVLFFLCPKSDIVWADVILGGLLCQKRKQVELVSLLRLGITMPFRCLKCEREGAISGGRISHMHKCSHVCSTFSSRFSTWNIWFIWNHKFDVIFDARVRMCARLIFHTKPSWSVIFF